MKKAHTKIIDKSIKFSSSLSSSFFLFVYKWRHKFMNRWSRTISQWKLPLHHNSERASWWTEDNKLNTTTCYPWDIRYFRIVDEESFQQLRRETKGYKNEWTSCETNHFLPCFPKKSRKHESVVKTSMDLRFFIPYFVLCPRDQWTEIPFTAGVFWCWLQWRLP